MDIRPIRTEEDHRAALAEIEALWDAPEGSDAAFRLDVLAAVVEAFEARRWPVAEPDWDPVDVLRHAIDEMGHTQSELAEILGSRSRASEVLARRRALTLEMVRRIHDRWKMPAELLIRPYKLRRKRVARSPKARRKADRRVRNAAARGRRDVPAGGTGPRPPRHDLKRVR